MFGSLPAGESTQSQIALSPEFTWNPDWTGGHLTCSRKDCFASCECDCCVLMCVMNHIEGGTLQEPTLNTVYMKALEITKPNKAFCSEQN